MATIAHLHTPVAPAASYTAVSPYLHAALSILKTVVSVCAAALAAGEWLGVLPNVQFSDCARWVMGINHIDGLDALVGEDAGKNANVEMANPVRSAAGAVSPSNPCKRPSTGYVETTTPSHPMCDRSGPSS